MTWLKGIALGALAVLAPVKAILISVFVLVILDSLTGVLAAHKRGEKITSAGMRRTVSKLLAFEIVLIAGHLFEKYLVTGLDFPVVGLLAASIAFVEMKSCIENVNTIAGTSLFKEILERIGSKNDTKLSQQNLPQQPAKKGAESEG